MRARINQIEANFYRGMERVGGFGGKANQLNSYYNAAGTPDYFEKDLARYRALTRRRHPGGGEQVSAEGSAGGTERRSGEKK